ncbi:50S ribosomal protein L34 [Candidatus Aerophobetes bacterium]|nr:50S ribosomal protein L34 [Candidatus Aerophobetes bacterium]
MTQYGAKKVSNRKRIGYRKKSAATIKRRRQKGRKKI